MAASTFRIPDLARRLRPAFAASLILTSCFVVLTAGPVRACDVLDPTCIVETVDDTVDDAAGTVDDTIDDTTEGAEETVETAEETVESATGDTADTVEEAVAPGIGPVDDVIDGLPQPDLPGSNPVPPGTVEPAPSGGGADNGSGGDGSGGSDRPIGTPAGGVAGPFALDPPALGSGLVIEAVPAPRGFLGGLAGPAAEVASRIAFPLALAVLVLLFIAFQNRLDRRDPKLALAATSPDVLRFG